MANKNDNNNDVPSIVVSENKFESPSKTTTTKKTTTTTTTTTLKKQLIASPQDSHQYQTHLNSNVAYVEDMGRQANLSSLGSVSSTTINENRDFINAKISVESQQLRGIIEGNKLITTISTIAAQSGQSRIVLVLLKDGDELQLKIQEMKPGIFEVGFNYKECIRYFEEHQKLVKGLRKLRRTPIEAWLEKYNTIKSYKEPKMSNERKLIYMCMLENLQACWKSLLGQLERRTSILKESSKFYEHCEQLLSALDRADNHVQLSRQLFLNGPSASGGNQSQMFMRALRELEQLNENVVEQFNLARLQQNQVFHLIQTMNNENLGDSRANHLFDEAQQLINYILSYLEPLERRKIQLESVVTTTRKTISTTTTTTTTTTTNASTSSTATQNSGANERTSRASINNNYSSYVSASPEDPAVRKIRDMREISNFSDLDLVEGWLELKIEQLNSSLLSSLGVGAGDSRSILAKHEQIALECGAIEEGTLNFKGKNIHAIKQPIDSRDDKFQGDKSLFNQQKLLAEKVRDVITILDVRTVLLRRTIEFYTRSKEATIDIGRLMRRLQVDNSLQSVQFVENELESKDVSSVVASGATILSELQQLQLAQQQGQRPRIVNLNLVTLGIRSIIDQLNRDLAHLKTVSNQRRLVLLNEDANKMVANFTNKCQQLHLWLNNQAKVFLLNNNRLVVVEGLPYTIQQTRGFCENHELLRVKLQNKTLEVEALLRSLPTLAENFGPSGSSSKEDKANTLKVQHLVDELRHDWINVTNCFDKRLELARKYLSILQTYNLLDRELHALEQFLVNGTPMGADERTDEEIKSNVEQISIQLANQVKNFTQDAQKNNTELVHSEEHHGGFEGTGKMSLNDINKKQVVDYVNNLLKTFEQRYNRTLRSYNQPSNSFRGNNVASPRAFQAESSQDLEETNSTSNKQTKTNLDQQVSMISNQRPPAHQRPQQVDPPRFTRLLQDKLVEPFSQVELECETDLNSKDFKLEWFMNDFKRIPTSVKHSIVSENNQHKLIIYNFSPVCCGTYQVRASNQAGQVTSQCRLKMAGIQEHHEEESSSHVNLNVNNNSKSMNMNQNQNQQHNSMARIIQGVESPASSVTGGRTNWRNESTVRITQVSSSCDGSISDQPPATQSHYYGPGYHRAGQNTRQDTNHLHVSYIDSPVSSASLDSRSPSRSPFAGTPQPPVFTHSLKEASSGLEGCPNQAGLVCMVIGNPAPKIEWLHNDKRIASARIPKLEVSSMQTGQPGSSSIQKGNVCKLVIETINPNTEGNYICRATNRLGQSSTAITLSKQ